MKSITDTIYDAQKGAYEIQKVTETHGPLGIPEAYRCQDELIGRLVREGSRVSGYKMGLTSREKMVQMGIDSPIYGVLLEEQLIRDGRLSGCRLIHPKAEPEIAVLLNADVAPDASIGELEAAIGWIAPAIEIIDSRFKDFQFTMADVVADNCSFAGYALGTWLPYPTEGPRIDQIRVSLIVNDTIKTEGVSSAVLGSPLNSLDELRRSLAGVGRQLKEGQVVLTGAVTAAVRIFPGDIVIHQTQGIGAVGFQWNAASPQQQEGCLKERSTETCLQRN